MVPSFFPDMGRLGAQELPAASIANYCRFSCRLAKYRPGIHNVSASTLRMPESCRHWHQTRCRRALVVAEAIYYKDGKPLCCKTGLRSQIGGWIIFIDQQILCDTHVSCSDRLQAQALWLGRSDAAKLAVPGLSADGRCCQNVACRIGNLHHINAVIRQVQNVEPGGVGRISISPKPAIAHKTSSRTNQRRFLPCRRDCIQIGIELDIVAVVAQSDPHPQ